jgi:hypothetical protein
MKQEISTFSEITSKTPLKQGMVVDLYRYNTYRMLIAGLFTADDKIGIQYKLPYSIDQIQIRFRFFIVINDHLLVIEANDKIIY